MEISGVALLFISNGLKNPVCRIPDKSRERSLIMQVP